MKTPRLLLAPLFLAAVRSQAGIDSWTALQAALDVGGTVMLTENLAASGGDSSLVIRKTVTLDLAGHAISGNGKDPVVSVGGDGNLTLTNSMEAAGAITGGGRGVTVNGGAFTMNGGTIANNVDGGVVVTGDEETGNSGSFTMNGGKIVGNSAVRGGGVRVFDSEFTMNGGVISCNAATEFGGGVMIHGCGSLVMNGGKISGNSARAGGGVCATGADFNGHAFLVGVVGVFAMSGGDLSGNCAEEAGGGVFLDWGGAMIIRGAPVVSGNTNSVGAASNVHLNQTWIEIQGLSAGASIGVTTATAPTASAPVTFTYLASESDAACFFSDNPRYSVGTDEYGELCLVADMALPAYLDGADDSVKTNWVNWATRHGAVKNDACEAAFLLDVAPAAAAACTGALLRVASFEPTATGVRLELASDIPGYRFFQPAGDDPIRIGNGIAVVRIMRSPSAGPDETIAIPVRATVDANGNATFEMRLADYLGNLPAQGNLELPSPLFFRSAIGTAIPDYRQLFLLSTEP